MNFAVATRSGGSLRRPKRRIDGILLFDKPVGPSSNQALQSVKRLFQAEKAGHTGTLDPFASGLLPILFGEATKFSSFLLDASKTYEARVVLGITTSTGDTTGEVLGCRPVSVSDEDVHRVVYAFLGEQEQTPPMYSALKRDGIPLYALARRGEEVERLPRRIVIEELTVLKREGARCNIRVRCSKGTYVRVLAQDIGEALGCGASLEALRRVSVATFDILTTHTLDCLQGMDPEELSARLLPVDAGLGHLPRVGLDPDRVEKLKFGQAVPADGGLDSGCESTVRVYEADSEKFLGIARWAEGYLQPLRLVVP